MTTPNDTFPWLGNELCLDFHNTITWPHSATADDVVDDFPRLLAWCDAAGIIGHAAARKYREAGDAGQNTMRQARAVRQVIHDVFTAITEKRAAPEDALAKLNDFLSAVVIQVDWGEGTPLLASDASGDLHPLLSPIVWSAASLLVSPYRDRIGRCSNAECGFLYVDLSRRGNRRWCDMGTCGNRAKAQRHYHRHK